MAGGGERRMVFDIRGKRKHVVKVVYAILALLMGSSLFLVVGPVNIGSLLGNSGSSTSAAGLLEEQAVKIERKLKKNPEDEALLAALVRTRSSAGNASVVTDPATQQQEVPPAALKQYALAGEAWSRYLKATGSEPKPSTAQLAATAFFTSAQYSGLSAETKVDLESAAHAQKFVASATPTIGSLSTLAIYQYFSLDFPAGDKTAKRVEGLAGSKSEAKSAKKQLAEYRKQAQKFQEAQKEFAKSQSGTGKQALENPLGGLSGGGSTLAP